MAVSSPAAHFWPSVSQVKALVGEDGWMGTNKNSIRMYGIYTYIWIVLGVNTLNTLGVIKIDTNDTSKLTIHVGKYTILIGCLGMGGWVDARRGGVKF